MSSRKFFKTNQSANKRILRSSSQKSKRHRPSEDEPPIENTREESSDDSGLSDHESSTSIFSDEFDDNRYTDNLEPLFRCSTPVRNAYHREPFSRNNFNLSINRGLSKRKSKSTEKVDLWEKAMSENPTLRNWIDSFNDEMKMVDQSTLMVKSTDSKDQL